MEQLENQAKPHKQRLSAEARKKTGSACWTVWCQVVACNSVVKAFARSTDAPAAADWLQKMEQVSGT
eukprot:592463-Amphidinium_carterae.1